MPVMSARVNSSPWAVTAWPRTARAAPRPGRPVPARSWPLPSGAGLAVAPERARTADPPAVAHDDHLAGEHVVAAADPAGPPDRHAAGPAARRPRPPPAPRAGTDRAGPAHR